MKEHLSKSIEIFQQNRSPIKERPPTKTAYSNILIEDEFINLINNLSESIKNYYLSNKSNNEKSNNLIIFLDSSVKNIISLMNKSLSNNNYNDKISDFFSLQKQISTANTQIHSCLKESRQNLKIFIDQAKVIFKQMKQKRNSYLESLPVNNTSNKIEISHINKFDYSNFKKRTISNIRDANNSISPRNSKIIRTTSKSINTPINNRNMYRNYFDESNLTNGVNSDLIHFLVNKLKDYFGIIGKYSPEAKEKFINLYKQIIVEIEKTNLSNSSLKNPIVNNNRTFCENPRSITKNLLLERTNSSNNYYFKINSDIEKLKKLNNEYKIQIKELNFQNEDLKSTIKTYQKTLEDCYNQLQTKNLTKDNNFNEEKGNNSQIIKQFENEILLKNKEITEIKKKYSDLEFKVKDNICDNEKKIKQLKDNINLLGVQHEKQIEKLKQEINILTAEKQKEINENIRKENEINQLKYETEKLNQVIKTNTQQFNKANEDYKSQINNLQNEINLKNNNESYINEIKQKLSNMESLYDKLKLENDELKKQKEQLEKNLSNTENNFDKLKIETNLSKINLNKEINELKKQLNNSSKEPENFDQRDKNFIDIKKENERLIQKLKEYKNDNDLLAQQINVLKERIKEDKKKTEKTDKDEQIEGLNMVIDKLVKEKEKMLNMQANNKNNDLYKLKAELNEANNNIKLLNEKIEFLEKNNKEENYNINYTDCDEEFDVKKMMKKSKNKNMSDDIHIDYPGINDIKEKYNQLEEKYRKVEKNIINLLIKIKCSSDIENIIIELCEELELSDEMTNKIINNR